MNPDREYRKVEREDPEHEDERRVRVVAEVVALA